MHITHGLSKRIRLAGNILYTGQRKGFSAELRKNIMYSPLHSHSYFEIELLVSGEGRTNINGTQYPLKRGSVSFVAPTDFHDIDAIKPIEVWNLAIIDVPEIAEELFGGLTRMVTMNEEDFSKALSLLSCIESEQKTAANDGIDVLCFEALLMLIVRGLPHSIRRGTPVFQALSYIRMNFREKITEGDVAQYIGFTGEHLSRKFKSVVGVGVKEYITALRIDYSMQLLNTTDMTLMNVALESGFGNYSSFYRAFIKRAGITPNEYRKVHRQWEAKPLAHGQRLD